jgi:hypothetical protein
MIRVLAVLAVLSLIAAARPMLARSHRRADNAELPDVHLADFVVPGTPRTWVVFTTPYCATCGPLMDEIEHALPDDGVVGVDATDHPDLTGHLGVRRSPTVFEIDPQGRVIDRMIGAEATRAQLPRVGVA